jgi:hypothetical protein
MSNSDSHQSKRIRELRAFIDAELREHKKYVYQECADMIAKSTGMKPMPGGQSGEYRTAYCEGYENARAELAEMLRKIASGEINAKNLAALTSTT